MELSPGIKFLIETTVYIETTITVKMTSSGWGLESEEEEEGHHQTEETHSFRQSESKNSVGEQLLLQAGVPETSNLLRTYLQH